MIKIEITPEDVDLYWGQKMQFLCTATYSDGSTENVTDKASWTTCDECTLLDKGYIIGYSDEDDSGTYELDCSFTYQGVTKDDYVSGDILNEGTPTVILDRNQFDAADEEETTLMHIYCPDAVSWSLYSEDDQFEFNGQTYYNGSGSIDVTVTAKIIGYHNTDLTRKIYANFGSYGRQDINTTFIKHEELVDSYRYYVNLYVQTKNEVGNWTSGNSISDEDMRNAFTERRFYFEVNDYANLRSVPITITCTKTGDSFVIPNGTNTYYLTESDVRLIDWLQWDKTTRHYYLIHEGYICTAQSTRTIWNGITTIVSCETYVDF